MPDLRQDVNTLRMTAYASLLAALTAVGAYIAVPVGPVPIVLQNLFVYMTGLLLGRKWGAIAISVYILAGICGLPVFSGGRGGIGHLVGPTGGYLVGFLPAVFIIGALAEKGGSRLFFDLAGMLLGTAVIYALGVSWLKVVTGMGFGKALTLGMFPFLAGDAVKIAAAIPLARILRPIVNNRQKTASVGSLGRQDAG